MSTFLRIDMIVGLVLFYVYMAGLTKRHLWPKYEWTAWYIVTKEGSISGWGEEGHVWPAFVVVFWPLAWPVAYVIVPTLKSIWKLGCGTFKAGAGKDED